MSLATLLVLADGRLPAGGHAHSGGVEAAVAAGRVRDVASLEAFLRGRAATSGVVAATFAAAACAAAAGATAANAAPAAAGADGAGADGAGADGAGADGAGTAAEYTDAVRGAAASAAVTPLFDGDERALRALDDGMDARTASPALRAASRAQGRALLRAAARIWPDRGGNTTAWLAPGRDTAATRIRPGQDGAAAVMPPDQGAAPRMPRDQDAAASLMPTGQDAAASLMPTGQDATTGPGPTGQDATTGPGPTGQDATTGPGPTGQDATAGPMPTGRDATTALTPTGRDATAGPMPTSRDGTAGRRVGGPHHAVAVGIAAARAGLQSEQAALAAVYGGLSGAASAAVRLLGLDPFAVHALLARLAPECDRIAAEAVVRAGDPVDDLPAGAAPLLDIDAEHHATWEVRLFAS